MSKIYNIRVQSPFVLIPRQIKDKMGIGYKVLSIEVENEIDIPDIKDVDTAVEAIIKTGYRALARAFHPDLGGDPESMILINRSKKELLDLLTQLR